MANHDVGIILSSEIAFRAIATSAFGISRSRDIGACAYHLASSSFEANETDYVFFLSALSTITFGGWGGINTVCVHRRERASKKGRGERTKAGQPRTRFRLGSFRFARFTQVGSSRNERKELSRLPIASRDDVRLERMTPRRDSCVALTSSSFIRKYARKIVKEKKRKKEQKQEAKREREKERSFDGIPRIFESNEQMLISRSRHRRNAA